MSDEARIMCTDPGCYGPGPVLDALGAESRGLLLDAVRGAVFGQTGNDFFSGLAHFLYAVVGAELVLVGKLADDDSRIVETIACYRHGERVPNIRYTLAGTPCANVVGPPRLCAYSENVAAIFPDDEELATMDAQGYVGLPLFTREGRQIGLLSLVTTRRIEDSDTLAGLLLLVGTRASLELEYQFTANHTDGKAQAIAQLLVAEDERIRRAVE